MKKLIFIISILSASVANAGPSDPTGGGTGGGTMSIKKAEKINTN